MFHLTLSNRFETLLEALLAQRRASQVGPFGTDPIIVPSLAVQRRLEMAMARSDGICSGVQFSFLAQWLWQQFGKLIPVGERSPFAAAPLAWRILDIFQDTSFVARYDRLRTYLNSTDPLLAFDLARQTAALFEQYLVYRSDWLEQWHQGSTIPELSITPSGAADQAWQAALWQRLCQSLKVSHSHPATAFLDTLNQQGPNALARAGLPTSVLVFGLTSMPPLYRSILEKLSSHLDIHVYAINPCREYWFDIVDPRHLARLQAQGRADHHDSGNRLLSAWGKPTQVYLEGLLCTDNALDQVIETSVDGKTDTRLTMLQRHILDLTEPTPGSLPRQPDDRSLELHRCHSLTRELEVLHDQLLAMFDEPSTTLTAADVLVVMPGLDEAAALIDAVFGTVPHDRFIPYVITGLPARSQNPTARCLLDVMAVAASRFRVSEVFSLLQQPLIARRFGLDEEQTETIHRWLQQTGVHWGLDSQHRQELGLPPDPRYTFDAGLDLLFAAYATPEGAAHSVLPRAPVALEGDDALTLGRFQHVVQSLAKLRRQLRDSQPILAWQEILQTTLDQFIDKPPQETENRLSLQGRLAELTRQLRESGYQRPLSWAVMQRAVEQGLDDVNQGGTPSGSVTFAAIGSLRQIPYRVICVLGLNDQSFPTPRKPQAFDLMAMAPRRTDRQRRHEERAVFLDLLLAARERLYLSHTGRSVTDNSPLPPSVLVSDLLDVCVQAMVTSPGDASQTREARRCLIIEHPLQPFSTIYFETHGDPRQRSYRHEFARALMWGQTRVTPVFCSDPLPRPHADADTGHTIGLTDLISFFANPAKHFLTNRLGMALAGAVPLLDDNESFEANWRSQKHLSRTVLPEWIASGTPPSRQRSVILDDGYPPGAMGDIQYQDELDALQDFVDRVRPAMQADVLPDQPRSIDLHLGMVRWTVTGHINDLRPQGLVRYFSHLPQARDRLSSWITHLFLQATTPPEQRQPATWFSKDLDYTLDPVSQPETILGDLLAWYVRGLAAPIRYFPDTSWDYASARLTRDDTDASKPDLAMTKARNRWDGSPVIRGDRLTPENRWVTQGLTDPLDATFQTCAESILGPLIAHLHEAKS